MAGNLTKLMKQVETLTEENTRLNAEKTGAMSEYKTALNNQKDDFTTTLNSLNIVSDEELNKLTRISNIDNKKLIEDHDKLITELKTKDAVFEKELKDYTQITTEIKITLELNDDSEEEEAPSKQTTKPTRSTPLPASSLTEKIKKIRDNVNKLIKYNTSLKNEIQQYKDQTAALLKTWKEANAEKIAKDIQKTNSSVKRTALENAKQLKATGEAIQQDSTIVAAMTQIKSDNIDLYDQEKELMERIADEAADVDDWRVEISKIRLDKVEERTKIINAVESKMMADIKNIQLSPSQSAYINEYISKAPQVIHPYLLKQITQ